MKLIVGLGNPGKQYDGTRHNVGALALKHIAGIEKVRFRLDRSLKSRIATIEIDDQVCRLALPTTYMNRSGEAVVALQRSFAIDSRQILVIHDDLDLGFGEVRGKRRGGAGGHRGIASIIDCLETREFNRFKIGIDKAPRKEATSEYVLSPFSRWEKKELVAVYGRIHDMCVMWVRKGIDHVMMRYN